MRKLIITILVLTASVAAVCQNNFQMIDILRNALQDSSISQKDRNFYNASLALMLKNACKGNIESDSLVKAAWNSEIRMPFNEQNYDTFKMITAYHILTANRKGAADAVMMAEKTFRHRVESIDSIWLTHRSFLLTTYNYIGDNEKATGMVTEDLQKIADVSNLKASKPLLDYLGNCNRCLTLNNKKDFAVYEYSCLMLIKYTGEYVVSVGAENVEIAYVLPLMKILSQPEFAKMFDKDEVLALYEQTDGLLMEKKFYVTDRSAYISFLLDKVHYLMNNIGDLEKADSDIKRALNMSKNSFERYKAYASQALLCMKRNDYVNFKKSFSQVSELAKVTGQDNYTLECIEAAYDAGTCVGNNDADGAVEAAERYFNILKEQWDTRLPFMTKTDQDVFISTNGDPVQYLGVLLDRYPAKVVAKLYDGILYRTGMQLRAQKEAEDAVNKSKNPDIIALRDSLTNLRTAFRTMSDLDTTALKLSVRIRNLERKIVGMVEKSDRSIKRLPKWGDVRDCLKEGEAAIEFIFSQSNLYALIVRKDVESPMAVRLTSNVGFVEFMNSHWSGNTVKTAKNMYKEYGGMDGLYHLLWQPMLGKLEGVKKIYMSVPGALNSISFNAIVTPSGSTLFDEYEIHQVTTTGNVTEKKHEGAPGEMVMLGDVAFSSKSSSQKKEENNNGERGVARRHFRQLPFALAEVDSIRSVLSPKKVRILTGMEASESNLREAIEKVPDVLHLATHGFYIADVQDALKVPYMNKHAMSVNSSMQRAGVALAGAEQSWTGGDAEDSNDGILTAMEVADMNLKGVRLVTLSACETALGNFNFEGIHGLPRGFKQAGVESLLVSLWSVNDKATSEFMAEFYKDWKKMKNRHAAYRMAMKKIRDRYPEAFYWASFIMLD